VCLVAVVCVCPWTWRRVDDVRAGVAWRGSQWRQPPGVTRRGIIGGTTRWSERSLSGFRWVWGTLGEMRRSARGLVTLSGPDGNFLPQDSDGGQAFRAPRRVSPHLSVPRYHQIGLKSSTRRPLVSVFFFQQQSRTDFRRTLSHGPVIISVLRKAPASLPHHTRWHVTGARDVVRSCMVKKSI
jgi:hypothetical protein